MNEEEAPIVIPAGEYLTIEQAAKLAGYSGAGNLRMAAADGRLRSIKVAPRLRLTTKEWLDAYLEAVREERRGWPRGKERGRRPSQDADEAPEQV